MVPTANEIIRNLLYFANTRIDFSEVIQQANDFTMVASILYDISRNFKCSSIALASLLLALIEKEFIEFAKDLQGHIIESGLGFDLDESACCMEKI
jgi:hypothetical protein